MHVAVGIWVVSMLCARYCMMCMTLHDVHEIAWDNRQPKRPRESRTRCMACGTRYMVHGTWYTVHGTWHVVHGTWYMAYGTRYMVHGTWCTVHGTWHMVHGTRYMARGTWCMVHGMWYTVHDTRYSLLSSTATFLSSLLLSSFCRCRWGWLELVRG